MLFAIYVYLALCLALYLALHSALRLALIPSSILNSPSKLMLNALAILLAASNRGLQYPPSTRLTHTLLMPISLASADLFNPGNVFGFVPRFVVRL